MILAPSKNGDHREAYAQSLVNLGFYVVPLHNMLPSGGCSCGNTDADHENSRAKHPRINDWHNQASCDPEQITAWWRKWPNANIGVQLGPKSDVVDFECDSEQAAADYIELFDGTPPETASFFGRRGKHYLFKWREGLPDGAVGRGDGFSCNGKARSPATEDMTC